MVTCLPDKRPLKQNCCNVSFLALGLWAPLFTTHTNLMFSVLLNFSTSSWRTRTFNLKPNTWRLCIYTFLKLLQVINYVLCRLWLIIFFALCTLDIYLEGDILDFDAWVLHQPSHLCSWSLESPRQEDDAALFWAGPDLQPVYGKCWLLATSPPLCERHVSSAAGAGAAAVCSAFTRDLRGSYSGCQWEMC